MKGIAEEITKNLYLAILEAATILVTAYIAKTFNISPIYIFIKQFPLQFFYTLKYSE